MDLVVSVPELLFILGLQRNFKHSRMIYKKVFVLFLFPHRTYGYLLESPP